MLQELSNVIKRLLRFGRNDAPGTRAIARSRTRRGNLSQHYAISQAPIAFPLAFEDRYTSFMAAFSG